MPTLHAIYAPHSYGISARILFEKLRELYEQGIRPSFVGCEGLRLIEEPGLEDFFEQTRKQLQDQLQSQGVRAEQVDFFWVDQELRARERTIRELNEKAVSEGLPPVVPEEELHESIHGYGLALAAGLFNVPLKVVEQTSAQRMQKILDHFERVRTIRVKRGGSPREAVKRFEQRFRQNTRANILRQPIVAENLKLLFQEHGGHGILVFGADHAGMEQNIANWFKRRGIHLDTTVRVEDPSKDSYSLLMRETLRNPSFKPSQKQLAAAMLDSIVGEKVLEAIKYKVAGLYNLDLTKPNDQFYANELVKNTPEYVNAMQRLRRLLATMQEKRIMRHIANWLRGKLNTERLTRPLRAKSR